MRVLIIILTIVMTFKPVLPLVDYAINYDYIVEVLCINKDKPELQCNGKCHLTAELAKVNDDASNQDKNNSKSIKRILQVEFLNEDSLHLTYRVNDGYNQPIKSHLTPLYSYLYSSSVFHPPLV